ncbi:MAG: Na/Pi symporter [Opitutales bacterium]|nr:Na/Pi symporter [Opitutales bacterium]
MRALHLPPPLVNTLKIVGIVFALYFFIVGVGGMGHAFKLFGVAFAEQLLAATSNPFKALCIGILATSLVQSSSTSTSIIVGMVAGGALSGQAAVFMIMGANIGTSITSMLVSLGHIHRKQELERAFSVASVHCFFNLSAVAILFPIEWKTGLLSRAASGSADLFAGLGGMRLSNPLKAATEPTIEAIAFLCMNNGWIMLIVTVSLTYGMLVCIVKLLRGMVLHRMEQFFDTHLFRNSGRAMAFGLLLTFAVQTSSVPTALVVPLAGAGILRLAQVYPYCLGSNMGTTMTAMLAALATGSDVAVKAAFAHLLFNILGILLIWPIPAVRRIPMKVAEFMGKRAHDNRYVPPAVILLLYFLVPAVFVFILN